MSKRKPQNHQQKGEPSVDPSFRLKRITPMTDTQTDVFEAYGEGYNLFLYGVAGTGKTYISTYLMLKEVLNPEKPYRKLVIVRSSVPSRDMGFMPGSLADKMSVYESPYISMFNGLFGRGDAYKIAVQKGFIEMTSTSFLRGMTFENCCVILDEAQNCTFEELDTLITRIGNNCRLILCGDLEQCDLYRNKYDATGLPKFIDIIQEINEFDFIEFQPEDIVRSPLVKSYLLAKRDIEKKSTTKLIK